MKKLVLKKLELTNFRGHKETTATFSDMTTITGDNGTGKSTIFEAFLWCLFGKDQFDRKDFEIIPTQNGKMLERVDSIVTATIEMDGRTIVLSRTLHQNWVRPRGQSEEVYKGNETLYQWDGVDIKAADYKARVDLLVEESIFKLITNPSAFLSLHWTKQREFLFQIAGTITDAQIAATDPKFASLLELVNGKKLAEFKKEIAAKKKKAKEELDDIQPRIDQTTKLMPEARDFAAIEKEISGIDTEIAGIDLQMQDRSKAIRGQYEAIQGRQIEINDLKRQQNDVVHAKQQQNQQDAFNANQQRTTIQNEVTAALQSLKDAERSRDEASDGLAAIRKKKADKEKEMEQLRQDWESENAKEYKAQDGCLICPVFQHQCADATAAERHADGQEKAKAAFLAAKDKKLDELDEAGAKLTEEINTLAGRIINGETFLSEAAEKVKKLDAEHEALKAKLAGMVVTTPQPVIAAELPEWQELAKQIKAIEATIEDVKPADNSDLNTKKSELNTKRDGLKTQLSDRDTIARYNRTISDLEARGKELAQQIANLEGQEFTINAFNKVKIDECDRRINGMFSRVRFQLFDRTLDGNEFEACIPTNLEGVPYAVTNTADQINIGLDIINTLSNFYNVHAPIFIDRCESINEPLNTGSQMIYVKVTAPGTPFQVK